jgi:predicted nucleic acid-binding protein
MRAGKKVIYWDTSVFFAWLKDEPWEAEIVDGIEATVRQVHSNQVILITSVVTDTEVLRSRMLPAALAKWEAVFKRRNVKMIAHDLRVGRKSSQIRDCFFQEGIKVATPDSIHLATAILYEADELQTLDGAGPTKKASDMIRLNGHACVDGLKIVTPATTNKQMSLLSGIPPEEKKDATKGRKFVRPDEEV